jgi:acetyl-CoA carboxylase alpha subunit
MDDVGCAIETALRDLDDLDGDELQACRREKFLEMGKSGLG